MYIYLYYIAVERKKKEKERISDKVMRATTAAQLERIYCSKTARRGEGEGDEGS